MMVLLRWRNVRTMGAAMTLALAMTLSLGAEARAQSAGGGGALSAEDAQLLQQSQDALLAGQAQQAAAYAQTFTSKHPEHPEGWRLLGNARYALGQMEPARDALVNAMMRGRLLPDVVGRLADIDRAANRPLQAALAAQWMSILEPDESQWRLLYGHAMEQAGQLDAAAAIYRGIVEVEPYHTQAWLRLGNAAMQQGDEHAAALDLETAYHLGDARPTLAAEIASLWVTLSEPQRALTWAIRAQHAGQPLPARSAVALASLLQKTGQTAQAHTWATQLVTHDDTAIRGRAHLVLATLAAEADDEPRAIEHLQAAINAGHTDATALRYLANHAISQKAFGKAIPHLEKALTLTGPDEPLMAQLIHAHLQRAQPDHARAQLLLYLQHFGQTDRATQLIASLHASQRTAP